jgi:hypothetical protein
MSTLLVHITRMVKPLQPSSICGFIWWCNTVVHGWVGSDKVLFFYGAAWVDHESSMIFLFFSLFFSYLLEIRVVYQNWKVSYYFVLCQFWSPFLFIIIFGFRSFFDKFFFSISSFNIEIVRNWSSFIFLVGWSFSHDLSHEFKRLTWVDISFFKFLFLH